MKLQACVSVLQSMLIFTDYYGTLSDLDKETMTEFRHRTYLAVENYQLSLIANYVYPYMDNMIIDSQI